jgi:hypothetical protein
MPKSQIVCFSQGGTTSQAAEFIATGPREAAVACCSPRGGWADEDQPFACAAQRNGAWRKGGQEMAHSLVSQLRFARSELLRCLDGVSAEDAVRRLEPMNCISWIVGHLANQEHVYWALWAQRKNLAPELQALVGYGRPASTPPPADMWTAWRIITKAADEFLDGVTAERLQTHLEWNGNPVREHRHHDSPQHVSLLVPPGRSPRHSTTVGASGLAAVRR